MRHATLRQLKVFEAIARHLSFTRAAEELHLTQPTVSMQIKQLSGTVGMPLFEQIGKRIHLTATGQALHATCHEIFNSIERFEMDVANRKGLKKGRLRLAVITTAKYFVPRTLGSFCLRYPGIEVSLKVTNRESVLERLANNLDDLYILGQPPDNLNVVYEPFLGNPLVVIAPSQHLLVGHKHTTLQRIAQEPFLMREPGSGTRMATQRLFDKHKIALNIRMELGSNEAIKQAVQAGLGLGIVSIHTVALELEVKRLAILDVQSLPIMRHWYIVHPKDKRLSPIAQAFKDFILQEAAELLDAKPSTLSSPE